jgi:hypothetical protein
MFIIKKCKKDINIVSFKDMFDDKKGFSIEIQDFLTEDLTDRKFSQSCA